MGDVWKSKRVAIADSSTEILAAVEGGFTKINSMRFENIGGEAVTVDVTINKDGAGDDDLVQTLQIASGEVVTYFSPEVGGCILNDDGTNDTIDATASAAGDVVAFVSDYMERT